MALTAYTSIGPTSGAANTKGAYSQIVASTPYDSSRLVIVVEFTSNTALRLALLDLATGAAGSESVVVANLALNVDSDAMAGAWAVLHLDLPAGTRLATRIQSSSATQQVTCNFYLDSRAVASLSTPVTYGADTANSRGTQVDPGTTINTKGAYVQLTASTSARIDTLLLCLTPGTTSTTITASTRWFLDIATGAAGSETVVLPDLDVVANAVADTTRPTLLSLPVSIPAGTRIAVRCQCNRNTATERVLCVTLIGMQEPAAAVGSSASSVAYLG